MRSIFADRKQGMKAPPFIVNIGFEIENIPTVPADNKKGVLGGVVHLGLEAQKAVEMVVDLIEGRQSGRREGRDTQMVLL